MIYVLYHANCFDGMGAYYAAWKKFGKEATYIAASYGEPTPEMEPGSILYLLDFSYSKTIVGALSLVHKQVVVLDHHKTAEADLKDLSYPNLEIIFDMERSGAVIAWEYFHPQDSVPDLLIYIQDRDLWKFKYPESKTIGAGLRSVPFDVEKWDRIIQGGHPALETLREQGELILTLEDTLIDKFCQEVMWGKIGGYIVPIINISTVFSEATAALLTKNSKAQFSAYFYIRKDGLVQFGLRSKGDMDVSAVATQYRGGGHKNAAGFVTDLNTLKTIVSETQIY